MRRLEARGDELARQVEAQARNGSAAREMDTDLTVGQKAVATALQPVSDRERKKENEKGEKKNPEIRVRPHTGRIYGCAYVRVCFRCMRLSVSISIPIFIHIFIDMYICMGMLILLICTCFHASMDMHTCMALPCLALQYTAPHEVTIHYTMHTYRAEQSIVLHYLHMYLPLTPGAETERLKPASPLQKVDAR